MTWSSLLGAIVRLRLHEHRLDVLLQQVLRDQSADDGGVCLQRLVVRGPHLRRHLEPHMNELAEMGIRPDGKPPNIVLKKKHTGGININSTVKLTKLNERTIREILNVYEVHNSDILFHEDADADRLIDYLVGNRVYIPLLVIVNKTDLVDPNYLKHLDFPHLAISAEKKANLADLKEAIYKKLKLIRLYLRHRDGEVDYEEPMIIKQDAVIEDVCNKIHTDMVKTFKYAQVWGKSAHFGGEKAGLAHKLEDGDVVLIVNK